MGGIFVKGKPHGLPGGRRGTLFRGSVRPAHLLLVWFIGLALSCRCGTTRPYIETEYVWPLPPDPPRIQYLTSLYGEKDLGKSWFRKLKETLAGTGYGNNLVKPYGVAADDEGRLFVADMGTRSVLVFRLEGGGKKFDSLGDRGQGQLISPVDIATDGEGRIYVSDSVLNTVYCYNRDLTFSHVVARPADVLRPSGLAFDRKNNRLLVVDTKGHAMVIFDPEGHLLKTVGQRGRGQGQFNFPTNVTVDSAGTVYVVDTMNQRVQIFDDEFTFLQTFGQLDNVPGSFTRPKGVAVDSKGHIYVVDAAFDNVQVFDRNGQLLLFWGTGGHDPGEFWLPAGICIDDEDTIYIADQYNRRVQIFQYMGDSPSGRDE